MASPGLQTFCCMFDNISDFRREEHIYITPKGMQIYNTLCMISSSVSILGAIYQLWPKPMIAIPRGRREAEAFLRQNSIICWLALADLFASLGILIRSALWVAGHIPMREVQETGAVDFAHLFCAISSAWIQYFYICTYFWTFCYALDTFLISQERNSHLWLYHVISWFISAIITGAGLIPLYDPELLHCEHKQSHLVPHYVATYIPILLVMVCNPVLYTKTARTVRKNLLKRGRYTDHERKIVRSVNEKFLLVILVFYLCWFPNILNGVLLLFWRQISSDVFLGLWQFMGILNPVQAFLNTLVYRGSGGLYCNRTNSTAGGRNHLQDSTTSTTEESTDRSPLLSFRR